MKVVDALVYREGNAPALVLLGGVAVLYIPTYWTLATGTWRDSVYAHGPIVLLVVIWLAWRRRDVLHFERAEKNILGTVFFVIGLSAYVVGRSQDILLLEVGSQIPVFLAILLLFVGKSSLRALRFPLFYMVFLVPMPAFVVDTLTGPLKHVVSATVENILYIFGFPIARSGVVLSIGPYRLMVADACSGLNSAYALCAMTALFIYIRGRVQLARNLILAAAIIPIALATNITRVCVLVLVTYYFGDAAGQGFLHNFAGVLEFAVALLLLLGADGVMASGIFSKKVEAA